jgi:hypothetical protein
MTRVSAYTTVRVEVRCGEKAPRGGPAPRRPAGSLHAGWGDQAATEQGEEDGQADLDARDGRTSCRVHERRQGLCLERGDGRDLVKGKYSNAEHKVNAAEIAIAGKRVAWIKRQDFGNTEAGGKLYTAPIAGRARLLKQTYVFGRNDSCQATGSWIGGAVGSGKVLAVSTWKSDGTVSSEERLSLITATRLQPIVTGPGAIVAASADGGRIAVLRSTAAWPVDDPAPPTTQPTVGIYSADGTLLREIVLDTPIPPPVPLESGCSLSTTFNSLALSGNRLVVLTETNPGLEAPLPTGRRCSRSTIGPRASSCKPGPWRTSPIRRT